MSSSTPYVPRYRSPDHYACPPMTNVRNASTYSARMQLARSSILWYASGMNTTPDQYMAALDLPSNAEVYRVGGSVRDEILGRQAKDSDYVVRGVSLDQLRDAVVTAGAKPSYLKLRTGKVVGVRAAVRELGLLEIVLPRSEISTGDGRHDFDIVVNPNLPLHTDAVRRDFTMNALYRNVKSGELVDPLLCGLTDVENRCIRTTHPKSFAEDPLRTLRALRFVSKLGGFDLVESTYQEMVDHSASVTGLTQKGVSATALEELCKLLMGAEPGRALQIMADSGVMAVLLPELEPMLGFEQRSRYHEKTTSKHTFDAVQSAANMGSHASLRVRLALLFHDCGKPKMAWLGEDGKQHYYALEPKRAIELNAPIAALQSHEEWSAKLAAAALRRLNASKRLRQDVVILIEHHMLPLHENIRPFKVRKWRAELGDELLHDLIVHRTADVLGKGGENREQIEVLTWIVSEAKRARDAGVPIDAKGLAINGHELHDIGLRNRDIGLAQEMLLHEVLAQPKLNTNEWLTKRAQVIHGRHLTEGL